MKQKAVYAGTFNPFTAGHLDVVRKAVDVFDLTILVADNSSKRCAVDVYDRKETIVGALEKHGINATVIVLERLVADYAAKFGIRYAIRGLRGITDYNYEEELANYNKLINPDLETVYFRADSVISSSFVREMMNYGKDVSKYMP